MHEEEESRFQRKGEQGLQSTWRDGKMGKCGVKQQGRKKANMVTDNEIQQE